MSVHRCFVVSLPEDADRRRHMAKTLGRIGLPFEFWPATRGVDIDPTIFDEKGWVSARFFRGKRPRWYRLNELGCALSHFELAQHILKSGGALDPPTLVLEDDVDLVSDFAPKLDGLVAQCPIDTDILYLGYNDPLCGSILAPGLRVANRPRGTYGYLIWPSGAAKLVDGLRPLDLPIDEELANMVRNKKLVALLANPSLVLHCGFPSRIEKLSNSSG